MQHHLAAAQVHGAGNPLLGGHQQQRDPTFNRGAGDSRQLIPGQLLPHCHTVAVKGLVQFFAVADAHQLSAGRRQLGTGQRGGVDFNAFCHQQRVAAQRPEHRLVFRQRRQDQRQLGNPRTMLGDLLVDDPKEPLAVQVDLVLLTAAA